MLKKSLALFLTLCLLPTCAATAASAKTSSAAKGSSSAANPSSAASSSKASSSQTAASKTATAKTAVNSAGVAEAAKPDTVSAKSVLLMEQSTGKILYELNPHEKLPCASITKIMTELLVLEAIEKGALKWDQKITCSQHASSMGGSDIWLAPNEVMTVRDLFKAMAVGSANDAAVALAEAVGGTEQAFVNEMNEKATALGMKDTHFVNATGFDADGHCTSANDVALMSKELMKHPAIFDYCTVWMDTLRGGKTQLVNTNKLVRFYLGCNGLKTGSTDKAGYCVSATAKRDGMQLIAVVMGAKTGDERFTAARHLLDYGFTWWAVATPQASSQSRTVRVLHGGQNTVAVVPQGSASVLVEKSKFKKIEQKVSLVSDVMAPVEKGQVLGQISFWVDGRKIGAIPLAAKDAVPRLTYSCSLLRLFRAFLAA